MVFKYIFVNSCVICNWCRVYEKETSEKFTQIYSSRKSPDSPGSFGFEETRRINQ